MTNREQGVEAYASQRARVEEGLTRAKIPPEHIAALLAIGRDAIALRVGKPRAADAALGVTRLGGVPDLPAGTDWPTRDGYEFDFVGQLRLDDLAPLDVHDRLPGEGLLSIFAGHDVTPTSEWQLAHRVEFYLGVDLACYAGDTASWPRHRRPGKACGLTYEPAFVLPPPWSVWLPEITHSAAYGSAFESIYQPSDEPLFPGSGLLGFDRMYGEELAADEWVLLCLADGEQVPYDFSEAVTLCFVIGDAALARRDLTDVRSFEGASV